MVPCIEENPVLPIEKKRGRRAVGQRHMLIAGAFSTGFCLYQHQNIPIHHAAAWLLFAAYRSPSCPSYLPLPRSRDYRVDTMHCLWSSDDAGNVNCRGIRMSTAVASSHGVALTVAGEYKIGIASEFDCACTT